MFFGSKKPKESKQESVKVTYVWEMGNISLVIFNFLKNIRKF